MAAIVSSDARQGSPPHRSLYELPLPVHRTPTPAASELYSTVFPEMSHSHSTATANHPYHGQQHAHHGQQRPRSSCPEGPHSAEEQVGIAQIEASLRMSVLNPPETRSSRQHGVPQFQQQPSVSSITSLHHEQQPQQPSSSRPQTDFMRMLSTDSNLIGSPPMLNTLSGTSYSYSSQPSFSSRTAAGFGTQLPLGRTMGTTGAAFSSDPMVGTGFSTTTGSSLRTYGAPSSRGLAGAQQTSQRQPPSLLHSLSTVSIGSLHYSSPPSGPFSPLLFSSTATDAVTAHAPLGLDAFDSSVAIDAVLESSTAPLSAISPLTMGTTTLLASPTHSSDKEEFDFKAGSSSVSSSTASSTVQRQVSAPVGTTATDLAATVAGIVPKQSRRKLQKMLERGEMVCSNCGTTESVRWRTSLAGEDACNACGIYERIHGVKRPTDGKFVHKITRRTRGGGPGSRSRKGGNQPQSKPTGSDKKA